MKIFSFLLYTPWKSPGFQLDNATLDTMCLGDSEQEGGDRGRWMGVT